jgi:hypothetical protein
MTTSTTSAVISCKDSKHAQQSDTTITTIITLQDGQRRPQRRDEERNLRADQ